jgi:hypothetical protein
MAIVAKQAGFDRLTREGIGMADDEMREGLKEAPQESPQERMRGPRGAPVISIVEGAQHTMTHCPDCGAPLRAELRDGLLTLSHAGAGVEARQ